MGFDDGRQRSRLVPVTLPRGPQPQSRRTLSQSSRPAELFLVNKKKLGESKIKSAYRGTLAFPSRQGDSIRWDIVAKTGEREVLALEKKVYERLARAKVVCVPTCLGLFDDIDDGGSILLTTYCGTSINRDSYCPSREDVYVPVAPIWRFI
jgi:hypothetical protein